MSHWRTPWTTPEARDAIIKDWTRYALEGIGFVLILAACVFLATAGQP